MSDTDPRILEAPPGRGLTPIRLLRAFAPGALGLVFGSRALASWAGRLPDQWAWPRDAIIGWDQIMAQAGLTVPYDRLHAWAQSVINSTL